MDIKIILCPYCGKPLESTKYSSDDIIQCKHCAQSFKKGFQKEESISIAIEEQKNINTKNTVEHNSLINGCKLIALAILIVGIFYCIINYVESMYDIIAVDRTTYRINKNTGKISLIYQNGKIIDVEPPLKQELRELWDAEENYLTGRGGLNQYDKNSFKATVYNGNSYVVVNTITFSVDFKHTKTGGIERRNYKVSVHIPPLSTQDVSFSILSSGPDYEFTGWGIDSAEGVDAPLPNLQTNK